MRRLSAGGGWQAIFYTWRVGKRVGFRKLWRAMRSRNACKTCALGMGGQKGGMVNEAGHFPEVCKKSLQAMAADMQGRIDPQLFDRFSAPGLRSLSPRECEHLGRFHQPLIYTSATKRYKAITWFEAYERIAESLAATSPDRSFFYASGRSSNEAAFLLQLFARAYGTNNVNNCSYYCHQASGVGLSAAIGSGTATVRYEDLDQCDLFFLIGGNPASNHPRLMTSMMRMRRRGAKVVVVNPLRELGLMRFKVPSDPRSMLFGSKIASHFVSVAIGGDLAFFTGLGKYVLENSAHDPRFIASATEGFAEVEAYLRKASWDDIVAGSGVERGQIEEIARLYCQSKSTVFSWTMGITHHVHGVDNVLGIVNLALLRGMIARPGAGLLPIRGHSNVQGIGTVGVAPKLKSQIAERLAEVCQIKIPSTDGLDTLSCLDRANAGGIDFAVCLGGNLWGATPDSQFAGRALGKIKTLVYLSTTPNQGHFHGLADTTIILPVRARDEEHQSTTQESMFNFVRLSDGGEERLAGVPSEVDVICEFGERIIGKDFGRWRSHEAIRAAIAEIVPGLSPIKDIGRSLEEFEIAGRVPRTPEFATPNRRAKFHALTMPKRALAKDQLMLMTIRSEGQFNTVVYEDYDLYRNQERRDVILMAKDDMAKLSLQKDQRVVVKSSVGEMRNILVRPFDIKPGNVAMYYPESNKLVPLTTDPKSRTPAFKAVPVAIEPMV